MAINGHLNAVECAAGAPDSTDTGPLLCCRTTFVFDDAPRVALLVSQDEPT